jgi:uncharacterized protein
MKRQLALLLLGALLLGGCNQYGCAHRETAARATVKDYEHLSIGMVPIRIQIAVTEPEQEKGLMYRTVLADGEGMLFVYTTPQKMAYWMNHVPIPLSIGFIRADGTLAEVREMLPNDTRSTVSSGSDIQYALEMNAYWFSRHNVTPGAKLDMGLLARILKDRGEEPERYGLK